LKPKLPTPTNRAKEATTKQATKDRQENEYMTPRKGLGWRDFRCTERVRRLRKMKNVKRTCHVLENKESGPFFEPEKTLVWT
jgi:hypothetical protein